MSRKQRILLLLIGFVIMTKFSVGIYEDDEFPETHLFIKHRPIWKTFFYSPRGMSDKKLTQMTKEDQKEQLLFDEFILEN